MNDWNGPHHRLDQAVPASAIGSAATSTLAATSSHHEVHAIHNVTLEIRRGEITGVIGENGSGKSTLLRLIAGVTRPTAGTVEVRGTVRGLLELGDNFNSLLTGAENAISDLMLEGLSRREATELLSQIGEFAGLQVRLDQPLRSYSTGMRLRLAFATATALPADIVLIDELLAVGDGHFQEKCIRRLEDLRDSGATILLTSHSIDHVTQLCDRAVWMVEGCAKEIGDAREVADHYNGLLHDNKPRDGNRRDEVRDHRSSRRGRGAPRSRRTCHIDHAWSTHPGHRRLRGAGAAALDDHRGLHPARRFGGRPDRGQHRVR